MRVRVRDYAVLVAITAALTLPGLGSHSLWDDDEGVNAQAAREMREADTWVIPTFNYRLRTAKPALLYWAQRASYAAFGVSEWSARLPSVLAGWASVLLAYELARRMFGRKPGGGRTEGLIAGVALASAVQFAALAHGATPDSVLLAFTLLAFLAFWVGHLDRSRRWWVPTAAACSLAVLTKGPVGVALPGLILLLYFAWNREVGRLFDRKIFAAGLVFVLIAGPWYALVASETRGEWLRVFLGRDNVDRFLSPLDGHRGPVWYYLAAVPVLFAPWSAFLGAVLWYAAGGCRNTNAAAGVGNDIPDSVRAHRFLVCWAGAYLAFFSAAATKLPNYILPVYPALAILTARFLAAWRSGELVLPRWVMPLAAAAMGLVGVVFAGGVRYVGGTLTGLGVWAPLGLVPVAGGAAMAVALRRGDRGGLVAAAAVAAVVFVGLLAALPTVAMDRYKAPRELVRTSGVGDPTRDLRVGARAWFQPSVVFYAGREVKDVPDDAAAVAFLEVPTPGYLFVPAPLWEGGLAARVTVPHRVAARHYDFLVKCDILVVTNVAGPDVAKRE